MVRRTKEEAAATRDSILDAAEILFAKQGVSRTTLQHIATAAGVTRGAIYWHFVDKGAVFSAMMDRATMPMDTAVKQLGEREIADPLQRLRDEMMAVLHIVATDEKARRVFEIATLKTEFTDEVESARVRKRQRPAAGQRRPAQCGYLHVDHARRPAAQLAVRPGVVRPDGAGRGGNRYLPGGFEGAVSRMRSAGA